MPTYVEYGAADIGVTGKDIFAGRGEDGFMKCWILALANAGCAFAGRNLARELLQHHERSVEQANIR